MGFEEFCATLLNDIGTASKAALAPGTRLYEDLGMDSLQVLLLLDALDQMITESGAAAGESDPVAIMTLGDAYAWYREQLSGNRVAAAS